MIDMTKPTLEGLSFALRHPETWPESYRKPGWHFNVCGRCAMGLAETMWPKAYDVDRRFPGEIMWFARTSKVFSIPCNDAVHLFDNEGRMHDKVQPADIADRIDAYIVTKKDIDALTLCLDTLLRAENSIPITLFLTDAEGELDGITISIGKAMNAIRRARDVCNKSLTPISR